MLAGTPVLGADLGFDGDYRHCPIGARLDAPQNLEVRFINEQTIRATWQYPTSHGFFSRNQASSANITLILRGGGTRQVTDLHYGIVGINLEGLLPNTQYTLSLAVTENDKVISGIEFRDFSSTPAQVGTITGPDALWRAFKSGDSEGTRHALSQIGHGNFRNETNQTPLHMAAGQNMVEIVTLLLSYPGADPNVRYTSPSKAWRWESNATPLHSAAGALSDNWGATQVLLAHGADANARTSNGSTALHLAAGSNGTETMKVLLAHGADINATKSRVDEYDDGWTPLHATATWYSDPGAAVLLLTDPSIDVNARSDTGSTTLHYAVTNNLGALVQVLLGHRDINPNAGDNDDWAPLHYAVDRGHLNQVQILLGHPKINPNARSHIGEQTPLHRAVYTENFKMVEILLDHPDTNPDRKNYRGEAALLLAVRLDLYDIAEALLDHPDTNPSIIADNGLTPLSLAAAEGKLRMVELLEDYGAEALGGWG